MFHIKEGTNPKMRCKIRVTRKSLWPKRGKITRECRKLYNDEQQ